MISSSLCELEDIRTDGTVAPVVYKINAQRPVKLNPAWVSSVREIDCPFLHTLEIQQTSGRIQDLSAITFDKADGSIIIATNDFAYDAVRLTLTVTKTSILSLTDASSAAHKISVGFKDICWESNLVAPQFVVNELSFDLYEAQTFFFTNMENTSEAPAFCGGFSYSLEYVSGPLTKTGSLSAYKISPVSANNHQITGTVSSNQWIGVHQLALKGTNGMYDPSGGARGNNGLFNSVLSEPLTLEITNPCLGTVLNPYSRFALPTVLTVPAGQAQEVRLVQGPRDSVSLMYGNGYDRCGKRSYVIYREDGTPYMDDAFTIYHYGKDSNGADLIALSLLSSTQGPLLTQKMRVDVYLNDYQERTKIQYPMTLEYRECYASRFEGASIAEQRVQVG